jgi:hypothetical protein
MWQNTDVSEDCVASINLTSQRTAAFQFCAETVSFLFEQPYMFMILESQFVEKNVLQIFRDCASTSVELEQRVLVFCLLSAANPLRIADHGSRRFRLN